MASAPKYLPVFVYGTLRPGERNFSDFLAGRTERIVRAAAEGLLFLHLTDEYRYPCLVRGPGEVVGELVYLKREVYEETLERLDALEDYCAETDRGLYLRREASVRTASGETEPAWVYFWNLPGRPGPQIESGDFKAWRTATKK